MDFFLLTKKNLQKKTVEKQDNLRSSIQPKICKTHLAIYQNFINKQKLINPKIINNPMLLKPPTKSTANLLKLYMPVRVSFFLFFIFDVKNNY
jgi:hypothetical protein